MLIDSPRLTAADRAHWAQMEHYDDTLAADRRLDLLAEQGRAAIREWAAAGHGVASTSWGKDSVVACELVATSGVDVPIVWARARDWETPECTQVRDAFLARHPGARYEEREVVIRVPQRGEAGYTAWTQLPEGMSQDYLGETIPERHVSGVRGQESRGRRISVARHGEVTARTCRPLARWSADQVFAYLHREDLPVHPVYAMSDGGQLDRRWLRVHALGCWVPGEDPGRERLRAAWEQRYYGDVLAEAKAARTPTAAPFE